MAGLIHDGASGFTGYGGRGGEAGAKAVAGELFRVEGGSGGAAVYHNRCGGAGEPVGQDGAVAVDEEEERALDDARGSRPAG